MKRRRVADSSKPEKACLALLAQPLECRHDLTEHLLDAECFPATSLANRIVQMEDVNPITAQSHQAVFERRRHSVGNLAETGARQSNFRANDRVGGFSCCRIRPRFFSD